MWKKLDTTASSSSETGSPAPENTQDTIDEMLMGIIRNNHRGTESSLPESQPESAAVQQEQVQQQLSSATLDAYTQAVRKFTKSASAFIECLPLLTEARAAYEEAAKASSELRKVLDSGDDNLRALMNQLQQMAGVQIGDGSTFKLISDRKKPEPIKVENPQGNEEARLKLKRFP